MSINSVFGTVTAYIPGYSIHVHLVPLMFGGDLIVWGTSPFTERKGLESQTNSFTLQPTSAEVSSLNNEPLHDAVDGCVGVVQRLERVPPLALLSRAEATKVLNGLWTHVAEEFKHNPASWTWSGQFRWHKPF